MPRRKPTFAKIGSVSGLGPAEDPIGDLAYALKSLLKRCRVPREVRKEHVALLAEAKTISDFVATNPTVFARSADMIDMLEAALEHYAPPYARFGQADSCEWGFWPAIDFRDSELPRTPRHGEEEWQRSMWGNGDCLQVNDHGNVSCGRFDRRGAWHEYWSIV